MIGERGATVNLATPPCLWTNRHRTGTKHPCGTADSSRTVRSLSKKRTRRRVMFTELTEELLDLEATAKGYGGALYAANDPGGSCCGGCCNLVLCCCCSQICW